MQKRETRLIRLQSDGRRNNPGTGRGERVGFLDGSASYQNPSENRQSDGPGQGFGTVQSVKETFSRIGCLHVEARENH
jgi:hypothetical protein